MKRFYIFAAGLLAGTAFVPATAAEVVSATFTQADGGQTVGLYSGLVQVTVAGTGFSLGPRINDAFYFPDDQSFDSSYYQLTFGTSTLVPFNPAQNAVNFIVGGRPAYRADHTYSFLLNTGTAIPSILHFGVGDGQFNDNGGSFRITVSQAGGVPEPATWGLMILGFGAVGGVMRRKRVASQISFA